MSFSTPTFWIFLAFVLAGLGALRPADPSGRHRRLFLALCSCFFYAAWEWTSLPVLAAISWIDWQCALQIDKRTHPGFWLGLSVGANLSLVAYFKYAGALWGGALQILVPLGISFFVFKTLSYVLDVYRGVLPACRSWTDYLTFVSFFPELPAGPIVRGSVFLPQLPRDIGPTRDRLLIGLNQFLQGLTKKFFIADRVAVAVDPVFKTPALYDPASVWLALLGFSVQLYCDFSGYSDMAVGAARMIGYDLPLNFRRPYASASTAEMARRWHITLGNWMRDYLFLPLYDWLPFTPYVRGAVALVATFAVVGLWHGASWNCLIWGLCQAAAVVVCLLWPYSFARIPGMVLTFGYFLLTLVWFRCASVSDALVVYGKLSGLDTAGVHFVPVWLPVCVGLMLCLDAMSGLADGEWNFPGQSRLFEWLGLRVEANPISGNYLVFARPTVAGAYVVTLWVLLLILFSPPDVKPFVYFQF